jgi:hypothetical protein
LPPGSFYAAFVFDQRFEMHYTLAKASWFNMVEIDLSILAKQYLDRRIDEIKILRAEAIRAQCQTSHRQLAIC